MDTALPQKIPFILDRNLAKANCTGNHVCTSCNKVVLGSYPFQWEINAFASFELVFRIAEPVACGATSRQR